ncbi:MAG: Asp-tRNA(Asn)/Glu-tRNA(Gln) amidotransferase subunit GatC [Candidatus Paceibacterota bacterium]
MNEEINIEKLARLSRISVTEDEKKALHADIGAILSYIEQIQEISDGGEDNNILENQVVRNVLREDGEPHETGLYTKDLLQEAPLVIDGYIAVKKIIDQNK